MTSVHYKELRMSPGCWTIVTGSVEVRLSVISVNSLEPACLWIDLRITWKNCPSGCCYGNRIFFFCFLFNLLFCTNNWITSNQFSLLDRLRHSITSCVQQVEEINDNGNQELIDGRVSPVINFYMYYYMRLRFVVKGTFVLYFLRFHRHRLWSEHRWLPQ